MLAYHFQLWTVYLQQSSYRLGYDSSNEKVILVWYSCSDLAVVHDQIFCGVGRWKTRHTGWRLRKIQNSWNEVNDSDNAKCNCDVFEALYYFLMLGHNEITLWERTIRKNTVIQALMHVFVIEITKNCCCQVFLSDLWLSLHECQALSRAHKRTAACTTHDGQ